MPTRWSKSTRCSCQVSTWCDIQNERYHTELISSFSKSQLFHAYDKGMTSYNDVFNLGNKKPLGAGVAFGTLLHDGLEYDGGLEQFVDESQTAPTKYVTSTGTLSQSKAAKEWYAEQTQRVIASGDKDKLMAMWEQLKLNHAVYDLWQSVQHHEVSKVWCRDDGVICRCRDDAITYEGEVRRLEDHTITTTTQRFPTCLHRLRL